MKNIFNKLNKLTVLLISLIVAGILYASTASVSAIQYTGDNTVSSPTPALNVFTGVPSVDNESDFVRIKKEGEANSAYRNSVDTTCNTGDKFKVWFYVHNGASQDANNNGTGPSVATGVKATVNLPTTASKSFDISGALTSNNAGNISDNAVINCGDKDFTLSYVPGSASAFLDLSNTNVAIPDSIVNGGTLIGTNALDGNVWGCWEQRVWIALEVTVAEKPAPKPAANYSCDLVAFENLDGRRRNINIKYSVANGAVFKNYDLKITSNSDNTVLVSEKGLTSDRIPYSYDFTKDGQYTAEAILHFTVDGQDVTVNCQASENIKTPVTVVKPVSTLPDTGAGSMIGLAVVITTAVSVIYYLFNKRKLSNQ